MNITLYKNSPEIAKVYIKSNGIVDAFVWKEGDDEWQVLEGDSGEKMGFVAATFKTKKDAVKLRDEINSLIQTNK